MGLVLAFGLILVGSALLGYAVGRIVRYYYDTHPVKEQWNEDKL
jgi:hypothetical protein